MLYYTSTPWDLRQVIAQSLSSLICKMAPFRLQWQQPCYIFCLSNPHALIQPYQAFFRSLQSATFLAQWPSSPRQSHSWTLLPFVLHLSGISLEVTSFRKLSFPLLPTQAVSRTLTSSGLHSPCVPITVLMPLPCNYLPPH